MRGEKPRCCSVGSQLEWNLTSVFVRVAQFHSDAPRGNRKKQFLPFARSPFAGIRLDRVATSALILFYEQTPFVRRPRSGNNRSPCALNLVIQIVQRNFERDTNYSTDINNSLSCLITDIRFNPTRTQREVCNLIHSRIEDFTRCVLQNDWNLRHLRQHLFDFILPRII